MMNREKFKSVKVTISFDWGPNSNYHEESRFTIESAGHLRETLRWLQRYDDLAWEAYKHRWPSEIEPEPASESKAGTCGATFRRKDLGIDSTCGRNLGHSGEHSWYNDPKAVQSSEEK